MSEWKLSAEDVPDFSTVPFFQGHPWVPPEAQAGHRERTAMVAALAGEVVLEYSLSSISDIGCGDGSLLGKLKGIVPEGFRMWGYDAGSENISIARLQGLDVRQADILSSPLEYGDLITCCEVVEHLAHPHDFIKMLPHDRMLVLSSPSAETDEWHYVHHAWAWDMEGYAKMVEGAGWKVILHRECEGSSANHCGINGPQRFQAIFAVKP